jgi:hypothetical protein
VRTLLVAAGGGGDAITAAAIGASRQRNSGPAIVMTYSWDRLMVDPLPGPRTAANFIGLNELAPGLFEVLPSTRPVAPAGSTLPRLAAELPARLLLIDPARGALGIGEQITAAVEHFRFDDVALVDVGGDALTDGADPGLRSPLADQLALAACVRAGTPAHLLITGAGLDGELSTKTITERLAQLNAHRLPSLSHEEAERVRHVLAWHPSEASGLLIAAAAGLRGRVEVRDAGDQVQLNDSVIEISTVDASHAAVITPAGHLADTTSLDEAEQIISSLTGKSEIKYETRKADMRRGIQTHRPTIDSLALVDRLAAEAGERGADMISTRRLSELLGANTPDTYAALTALLASRRPASYRVSTYATSPAR